MYEIDLLKQLRHENIVHLFGYELSNNHLEIVMEYCEGGSLRDTISKYGPQKELLVSSYIHQVLDFKQKVLIGLAYLHEQGVIHRDIKSANILTTKNGLIKLADFGIATRLGKDTGRFVGSPYWSKRKSHISGTRSDRTKRIECSF